MCKYCILIEILYAKFDGAFKLKLYFYYLVKVGSPKMQGKPLFIFATEVFSS